MRHRFFSKPPETRVRWVLAISWVLMSLAVGGTLLVLQQHDLAPWLDTPWGATLPSVVLLLLPPVVLLLVAASGSWNRWIDRKFSERATDDAA